jgi:hypothetical protein
MLTLGALGSVVRRPSLATATAAYVECRHSLRRYG